MPKIEIGAGLVVTALTRWRKAVEKYHLDIDFYAHQRWDTSGKLPWVIIDLGADPGQLEVELDRALSKNMELKK